MKHLKELKLNENKFSTPIPNINVETIKNEIVSSLIEDYEFTDLILTKPEVEFEINQIATKKMNEFRDDILSIPSWNQFKYLVDELKRKK